MLVSVVSVFSQESEITDWGKGLETSFGVSSGKGLPDNYSLSFQGVHDSGFCFSLDFIKAADDEHRSGLLVNSGLLGSMFLGIPFSKYFIPYVGGGLGIKDNSQDGNDDIGFAWKLDGGAVSWLTSTMYAKAGVSYDNIRESISVSVGVGFKFEKIVTASYLDYDGSTFTHTFTKFLWNDDSTPAAVYEDEFESSEVVRTYKKTTTSSNYSPAQYEMKTSGGETLTTTLKDQRGVTVGTATTSTPRKYENVKTKDAAITTYYYIYNVTVKRNWYTRTWYYKDHAPITQKVYQDTESAVLVDTTTEKSYLYD
jgi:hypothetical protein